jgi:hypothetical protein
MLFDINPQVLGTIITAVGSVLAAWIARPRTPVTSEKGTKMLQKKSFRANWKFIWVFAPIAGAALFLVGFNGVRAATGSGALETPAPFCMHGNYFPSGFMGDGEKGTKYVRVNEQWTSNCRTGPTCTQNTYLPGPKSWAGVYWQYPDGNWGDKPGRKIIGAKKLVFFAHGQNGGELVDFKAGGINDAQKKYQDSFERVLPTVKLKTDWQLYEIDLSDANTSSVIGGFAWSASANGNPGGLTFYLEDVCYQP